MVFPPNPEELEIISAELQGEQQRLLFNRQLFENALLDIQQQLEEPENAEQPLEVVVIENFDDNMAENNFLVQNRDDIFTGNRYEYEAWRLRLEAVLDDKELLDTLKDEAKQTAWKNAVSTNTAFTEELKVTDKVNKRARLIILNRINLSVQRRIGASRQTASEALKTLDTIYHRTSDIALGMLKQRIQSLRFNEYGNQNIEQYLEIFEQLVEEYRAKGGILDEKEEVQILATSFSIRFGAARTKMSVIPEAKRTIENLKMYLIEENEYLVREMRHRNRNHSNGFQNNSSYSQNGHQKGNGQSNGKNGHSNGQNGQNSQSNGRNGNKNGAAMYAGGNNHQNSSVHRPQNSNSNGRNWSRSNNNFSNQRQSNQSSFAGIERNSNRRELPTCFKCGGKGHMSKECPSPRNCGNPNPLGSAMMASNRFPMNQPLMQQQMVPRMQPSINQHQIQPMVNQSAAYSRHNSMAPNRAPVNNQASTYGGTYTGGAAFFTSLDIDESEDEYADEFIHQDEIPRYPNEQFEAELQLEELSGEIIEFVIDSGATHHLVNDCNHLLNMQYFQTPKNIRIAKKESYLFAIAVGRMKLKTVNRLDEIKEIILLKVYFVPELEVNLMSMDQITSHGLMVTVRHEYADVVAESTGEIMVTAFRKNQLRVATFYHAPNACPAEMVAMTAEEVSGDVLEINDLTDLAKIEKSQPLVARYEKLSSSEVAFLWHQRMGHASLEYLKKLKKHSLGLENVDFSNADFSSCTTCQKAKAQHTCGDGPRRRATTILETSHSDVVGPLKPKGVNDERYVLTFIDDFSMHVTAFVTKNRCDMAKQVEKYFRAAKQDHPCDQFYTFRSDNAKEYLSKETSTVLEKYGVTHETSIPYIHELNGRAERANRNIFEKVRALLISAKMPPELWPYAVRTAVYLINRLPFESIAFCTPYEFWYNGERPDLKNIRIF